MVDNLRAWWSKPSVLCLGEFLSKTVQSIFYYCSIYEFWFSHSPFQTKNKKKKKSKTSNRNGDQKGIYMKDAWKLELHINIKAQKPSHAQHVREILFSLHSSIISLSIMFLTQKAQIGSFQFSIKGEVWGDEPYHNVTFVHENQMVFLEQGHRAMQIIKEQGERTQRKADCVHFCGQETRSRLSDSQGATGLVLFSGSVIFCLKSWFFQDRAVSNFIFKKYL